MDQGDTKGYFRGFLRIIEENGSSRLLAVHLVLLDSLLKSFPGFIYLKGFHS